MTLLAQPDYRKKEDFITIDSVDSIVLKQTPDFLDYLFFHNLLDKYCFALKAHYSDRETVKKRRYRLDLVFQNYLVRNAIRCPQQAPSRKWRPHESRVEFNLSKGWHNELVRSDPLLIDYLKVGVQLSDWKGPGTGGFAAWNIIQSYYAVFEYFSALAATFSPMLKINGHKKLARHFNSQVLGLASKSVLFYPFSLSNHTKRNQIPTHPKHTEFHYASYPRIPGRNITDIDYELVKGFQFIASGNRQASILDLLYEFRLWANYTGVRSILKLTDGGYLGFLMKNLGTLVFFAGGLAELAAIRALGEDHFLAILRRFQRDYIDNNERFSRNRFLIPAFVRLRAYKHTGIIRHDINFIIPDLEDPIQFIKF